MTESQERRRGQTGRYRGESAAERAAERRTRLLDATLSVWSDPGTRTTMTAVCAAAKLSERYFYESFTDLAAAQRAVLESVASEIEDSTVAAANAAGPEPRDRIRAALAAFAGLLVEDPRKARVAIVEAGAMNDLRPRRTELLRHFADLATEQARVQGVSSADHARDDLAGLLFVGGLAEVVTAWLDGTLDTTPEEVIEKATQTYLSLYG